MIQHSWLDCSISAEFRVLNWSLYWLEWLSRWVNAYQLACASHSAQELSCSDNFACSPASSHESSDLTIVSAVQCTTAPVFDLREVETVNEWNTMEFVVSFVSVILMERRCLTWDLLSALGLWYAWELFQIGGNLRCFSWPWSGESLNFKLFKWRIACTAISVFWLSFQVTVVSSKVKHLVYQLILVKMAYFYLETNPHLINLDRE